MKALTQASFPIPLPAAATALTDGEVIGTLTVPEQDEPHIVTVNRSEVAAWHDTLELVPGAYDIVWRDDRGAQVEVAAFCVAEHYPALLCGMPVGGSGGIREDLRKPDVHRIGHSYGYQLSQLLSTGTTGYMRDAQHGGYIRERTFGGFEAAFHGDLEVVTTRVSVYEDRTHESRQVVRVDRHYGHDPAHQEPTPCPHGKLGWQGCTRDDCDQRGCLEPALPTPQKVTA